MGAFQARLPYHGSFRESGRGKGVRRKSRTDIPAEKSPYIVYFACVRASLSVWPSQEYKHKRLGMCKGIVGVIIAVKCGHFAHLRSWDLDNSATKTKHGVCCSLQNQRNRRWMDMTG